MLSVKEKFNICCSKLKRMSFELKNLKEVSSTYVHYVVRDPIVETSYKVHCAVIVNLLCDVYRLGPNKFWSQIYIFSAFQIFKAISKLLVCIFREGQKNWKTISDLFKP